jgi:hypothetical protein
VEHEERPVARHYLQHLVPEPGRHGVGQSLDPGVHGGIDPLAEFDHGAALSLCQDPHRRLAGPLSALALALARGSAEADGGRA